MTVQIQQVANTSTFNFWLNRTNELANVISTKAVTVESNSAVGNASIIGTFSSNNFIAQTATFSYELTINRVMANGAVGTNGQILTSNGNGSYWLSPTYTGSSATNTDYPVGSVVAVYTGNTEKTVASTMNIYTGNLSGTEGANGSQLSGTWRNRGLSGVEYRSPSEKYYYYLYQRVA